MIFTIMKSINKRDHASYQRQARTNFIVSLQTNMLYKQRIN